MLKPYCSKCPKNTESKNPKFAKKKGKMGDSKYINHDELNEAYFQHDMAYEDFKDLPRRTTADKILRDEAFNNSKNVKYDGY